MEEQALERGDGVVGIVEHSEGRPKGVQPLHVGACRELVQSAHQEVRNRLRYELITAGPSTQPPRLAELDDGILQLRGTRVG